MHDAVERAIKVMWARYGEPLTLAELADEAILSRFYFSRLFRSCTGTSPGRFLTAIRLYRAKNLLLATPATVTDITYQVGFNSLGTFTSRFSRSVGMSPTRYRYLSQAGVTPAPGNRPRDIANAGVVYGMLSMPKTNTPTRTYVAGFNSPIPEGIPAACDIVDSAGLYRLGPMPKGKWYVQAVAVARAEVDPRPWCRKPLFVQSVGQVWVPAQGGVRIDLDLHPSTALDLPILLALPELDSQFTSDSCPVPAPRSPGSDPVGVYSGWRSRW